MLFIGGEELVVLGSLLGLGVIFGEGGDNGWTLKTSR